MPAPIRVCRSRGRRWLSAVAMLTGVAVGCSHDAAPEAIAKPQPTGSARARLAAQASQATIAEQIGAGQFTGREYAHPYFEFALTLPPEWHFETADVLFGQGAQNENGLGDTLGRLKAQKSQTLLRAYRFPPGISDVSNYGLALIVETAKDHPDVTRGSQFLEAAARLLRNDPSHVLDPIELDQVLGELVADRLCYRTFGDDAPTEQELYAFRQGNYILTIGTSITADGHREEVHKVLATVRRATRGSSSTR